MEQFCMRIFCTLFDSNYLDKGLALYDSLYQFNDDFKLYVFAFDRTTFEILIDMKLSNMKVIGIEEFETDELRKIKNERSRAEYCWTCTPLTIEYVLQKFNEDQCTYLDADIYFFSSPEVLFNEIKGSSNSVIITEHRFPADVREKLLAVSGKYCVQFNTFNNEKNSIEILNWWKNRCLENCSYSKSGEQMGDQQYLQNWTTIFNGVHELQHLGGGMAPWNIRQYSLIDKSNYIFSYNNSNFQLVFYHFQNIRYLPFGFVNIHSGTSDTRKKQTIYIPYLIHIEKLRKMLNKTYGVSFLAQKSTYKNPVLKFIQKYIMPFKIMNFSDIISLKKLRNL